MLNDKEGFERFYEQVSILFGSFISEFGNLTLFVKWRKKELGIEEKVPKCVNRLMLDS